MLRRDRAQRARGLVAATGPDDASAGARFDETTGCQPVSLKLTPCRSGHRSGAKFVETGQLLLSCPREAGTCPWHLARVRVCLAAVPCRPRRARTRSRSRPPESGCRAVPLARPYPALCAPPPAPPRTSDDHGTAVPGTRGPMLPLGKAATVPFERVEPARSFAPVTNLFDLGR